jgi:hypothetical protein
VVLFWCSSLFFLFLGMLCARVVVVAVVFVVVLPSVLLSLRLLCCFDVASRCVPCFRVVLCCVALCCVVVCCVVRCRGLCLLARPLWFVFVCVCVGVFVLISVSQY